VRADGDVDVGEVCDRRVLGREGLRPLTPAGLDPPCEPALPLAVPIVVELGKD